MGCVGHSYLCLFVFCAIVWVRFFFEGYCNLSSRGDIGERIFWR